MGFLQSGVKCGAAMAVLSAALLGCSSAERLSPEAIVKTSTVTAVEEFTTKGKPTKPIETPWGPREVYDPAKDKIFRAVYREWFNDGFKRFNPYEPGPTNLSDEDLTLSTGSYFGDVTRLVQLDYLRSGCTMVVQSTCWYNEFVFKSNCENNHNYTSLELSPCEAENLTRLSVGNGVSGGCSFKDKRLHFGDSFKKEINFESSLSKFIEFECRIWRHEDGADYWKDLIPDPMKLPR